MVFKLKRSIYGLKQASRQWYLKFDEIITSCSFKENVIDQCMYLKVSGSRYIFLVLYVDDILLVANDNGFLFEIKRMKDLGEASYVLGVQILRDQTNSVLGLS
jgi:hypothetical protein